jgi:Ca2+-binding RTX toxin-like protein
MPTVTVTGANQQTVTLLYDTEANALLAQQLAAAISAGVQNMTIFAATDTDGPPPPLQSGKTGEFVQTMDGTTFLPPGYKAFVDTAATSIVFGSGDADESVLSSIGNMTFFATGGSGTVAAGGGNNFIMIPQTDAGNWAINTGTGDDTVFALGRGNDSIGTGGGRNAIQLGSGKATVTSTGDDTVLAGSGQETITALAAHDRLIYDGSSRLYYIGALGSGGATVFAGTGSDTFFGSDGSNLVYGGTAGKNYLFAGTGPATLFGGGDGDQLWAVGLQAQALYAASGNETLNGALSRGADTFYGGTGATSIIGGQGGDTFVFTEGQAGSDTITGFAHGRDTVDLQGYRPSEVANALKHAEVKDGSTTITLPDQTSITFVGITDLTAGDFVLTGGTGNAGGNALGNDTTTSARHGGQDDVDPTHIRNVAIGGSQH